MEKTQKQKVLYGLLISLAVLFTAAITYTLSSSEGLQGFIRRGGPVVTPMTVEKPLTLQPPMTVLTNVLSKEHARCINKCEIVHPEKSDSFVYCVMECAEKYGK